jgi:hypothetical protein
MWKRSSLALSLEDRFGDIVRKSTPAAARQYELLLVDGGRRAPAPHRCRRDLSNRDAIVRLVGAVLCETNDDWVVVRRYMTLDDKREEVEDRPKALKKAA